VPHVYLVGIIGHTALLVLVLLWRTRYWRLCYRGATQHRLLPTAWYYGSYP